ncbi:hypothetical protein [Mesorhizobium sp.]|nr:hypothetical protein [Mesorhizobium sp.]
MAQGLRSLAPAGLKSRLATQKPEWRIFWKQVRREFIGSEVVEKSPFIDG